MKVLIAEDDLTSRDILAALLVKNGYEVLTVQNGNEALDIMQQPSPPRIVLLDWLMPGIDGLEVCRRIREIKTDIPPYIIMLTIKGDKDDIITGLDTGADDYLSKPYDPGELRARIDVGRRIVELEQNLLAQTRILSVTHQNYETLFNTVDDFLFVLDEQGNILHTNTTVIKRLGYSIEELSGSSVLMVHPPEFRDEAGRIVGEMLSGKADFCPVPIMTKGGIQIPVETRISHGMWDGIPVIFGVSKDISKLKLNEERLQNIIKGTNAGTWEWNIKTGETNFNERWAEIVGYTLEELQPVSIDTWMKLVHPEDLEKSDELLQRHFNGDTEFYSFDSRMKHKDGTWVWVYDCGKVTDRDEDFKPLKMFGTHIDITERKKAENKISILLSEKELLLKEVHHRIKNNMSTIKGLLYLQADGIKDSAAAAALHDAENRVQSMMILYDKLYSSSDFTGMQSNLYFGSLADEIISNFPDHAIIKVDKKIEDFFIEINVLFPLGIIMNEILTNMMKYAFTGRKSGVITVSISLNGSHATFILGDDGNGFPDSISLENSTGFGLTLINMLTQQIGGIIRIERGEGTKFILEFEV